MAGERLIFQDSHSGIEITRLLNFPIDSNCFIISDKNSGSCIVVDPAHGEGSMLVEYLIQNNLEPTFVILTHEHFDHISSLEYLRTRYDCKVIASVKCSESISNSKKNLSLFFDQKGFNCSPADILIERNNSQIIWQKNNLHFYLTPGHSEGGLCFSLRNNLFTGDTLLQSSKTIVKLPGGDKRKLDDSINMISELFGDDTMILPGHGEIFMLAELNSSTSR
jgi:hydroxyacylglutathione hydrolase